MKTKIMFIYISQGEPDHERAPYHRSGNFTMLIFSVQFSCVEREGCMQKHFGILGDF